MSSVARARRDAYECAAAGDYATAVDHVLVALKDGGFLRSDCSNLAYLVFHRCDAGQRKAAYDRLRALDIDAASAPPALFLRLSFALDLGDEAAPRLVKELYLDGVLHPKVRMWPSRPILFWHVPKCSGTSINEALGAHFYSVPIGDLLPGYGFLPLVRYLAGDAIAEIPFLSSGHLSFDDLAPRAETFGFTALRDPARRCLSMYRQEQANFRRAGTDSPGWYHYRALPRYGAFWDYRRDSSFEAWLGNIPEWLLKRQISTFSAACDVDEAAGRLLALDYVLGRDFELGSEAELFSRLGIPWSETAMPEGLNRSDRDIEVPANAVDLLAGRLADEYAMLEHVKRERRGRAQGTV